MKKNNMYLIGLLCATGLCILGCEDDDGSVASSEVVAAEAVSDQQYIEIQNATEAITGVSGDAFLTDTGADKRASTYKITDCVERSSEEVNGRVTITLDYGEGCELGNGDTVSGVIAITYDQNDSANGAVILTTLENYRYNDISVTGNASSIYMANEENGGFIFSSETDLSFEWPDGLTAISYSLSETETVFAISDEAFDLYTLVSGNGNTEFSNGDSYGYEITVPLRSEIGCAYIVSGVMVSSENNSTLTRDYGDGSCDDIATETDDDGNTVTVDLDRDTMDNDNS
ncbi:hypothetical protein FK220_009520 [Flavobacteriaceae bacterium TP-CH-4]|uniref:Uncharacterized protein n=1 Tax=Pelagihabitans pacificus TaxID=2696054 RepID=A0A967AV36_9FLAO|nr:hypothetical protein [Pelagihabitans pacificus]NHF59578.1 hypothetical protein [Pelagihabitans pacificus]